MHIQPKGCAARTIGELVDSQVEVLTFTERGTLRLECVDMHGRPLPGTHVLLVQGGESYLKEADEQGHVEFDGLSWGEPQIHALHPSGWGLAKLTALAATAGDRTRAVPLYELQGIQRKVIAEDGEPVNSVTLKASFEGGTGEWIPP